ncbi:ankyrin repeat domain 13C [Reticulomyxa filosa]|uniref:Ankyrin repeat domain 13C n=1 Tax=Reticulomyxa filosa TaxID=46433 RepID=X6N1L1_RETFI|nr:ankyrin repeat domain 13C [Reticulomyxa filosa]|eukprot:ETO19931.1 ankyrin repeat domain 13C [Reticulomyxa filosa]
MKITIMQMMMKKTASCQMIRIGKAVQVEMKTISPKKFDQKSIYQQSTFAINRAPVKKTMKTFKLMLAISDKFGLTVEEMITILDAAAPTSKLARKLKEFLEIKMPPGFPVQLELPLYHVLKATVTFQNFKEMEVGDDIFAIPEDYLLVDKENVGTFEDDN